MSFQYTYDAKANAIGVFIPINEWEQLKTELKKVNSSKNSAHSILSGIKKGLKQVEQIEKNKLKEISIKQLLSEL